MRPILLAIAGSILAVTANPGAAAVQVSIAPDGMATVDGERVFVIGLYENPDSDDVLADVAKAGFNLVRASNNVDAIQRLRNHGLYAWVNTGYNIDLSKDRENRKQKLREMVDKYGSQDNLFVWEVPDEALWNCWYRAYQWRRGREPRELRQLIDKLEDKQLADELRNKLEESNRLYERGEVAASEMRADEIWAVLDAEPSQPGPDLADAEERAAVMCAGMIEGYELLKELDPNHPVWMNHAPRNQISQLAAFNKAADIVGCDIYPAPEYKGGHSDLGDRSLASVGKYTMRMQAAAPDKPVWMVLQGFGWADLWDNPDPKALEKGRRPDKDELRFMTYDAIVRGAKGVLYWGTASIEKDSPLWNDLLDLVREMNEFREVLAAPEAELDIHVRHGHTLGSVDRGVEVLAKDVSGEIWLLVVNEFQDPLQYTLDGLDSLEGVTYSNPRARRETTVDNGELDMGIRGYGVQLLAPQ